MVIERTKDEVIIRLPAYVDTEGLQRLINLLYYKEATAKSEATQAEVDELAKEVKRSRAKAQRLHQIEELTKSNLVDVSRFKNDRDRANDYSS